MRFLSLITFAILPITVLAQSGSYDIQGKIGKLNAPAKVYLSYRIGKDVTTDSAIIKNGVFELRGQVADPVKARLMVDHQGAGFRNLGKADVLEIYIEKGQIKVISPDSAFKAEVSGSVVNDENKKYNELVAGAGAKQKALMAEYYAASEEKRKSKEFQEEIDKRYDVVENELAEINKKYIQANPNSFISLDAIKSVGGYAPEVDKIEPLFNGLTEPIRNSASGKEFAAKLQKLKQVAIGAVAPDFTQSAPDDRPIKLSDFKGKYVLLDFWASWCGPCRAENPNVVKAYLQFKDKNFTILGVSLDSEKSKEAWLKAIEKDQLTWNHVSDLKGWGNAAAQLYSVQSIPQNFLIGPDGKIVAKNLRGDDLEKKLKEIFN